MRNWLIFFLSLALALPLNAQNLTVRFDNCTVEQALEQLKGKGISFVLKSESVDMTAKVKASFTDAPLEKIVETIFKGQNVEWVIEDGAVVVSSKPVAKSDPKQPAPKTFASGKVLDAGGAAVIGASIFIQGTNSGTVSDLNGKFSIAVDKEAFLVVSCIGYTTQKVQVKPGNDYVIVLEEDLEYLNEVVVIGFGSQKKVNLTGSVAVVSNKDIVQRPVQNVSQALQGLVPGLNIAQWSGLLDSAPSMDIRGVGTIGEGSSSAPLKMALQLSVGPFLFQNVPTLCLHLSISIENAWKHDGTVPPGGCVYEYSVMEISSAKLMEFPGNRYFHIISSTCRQIQDDNYEDPPRQWPWL